MSKTCEHSRRMEKINTKTSEFIDDIYFVREKGGRSKESIVYQRERMSRGVRRGVEQFHLGDGNSFHQH